MTALYRVHAIMISLATVFCAGFAWWSFQHPDEGPSWMWAFFSLSSVALAAYLVKFLKDKREGFGAPTAGPEVPEGNRRLPPR